MLLLLPASSSLLLGSSLRSALPAGPSLLLGSSLRSAQPAGLSFAQERAAIRMSVTMDDTLRSVLKEMPTRWGENMDVRMERAQQKAVELGGGPYAPYKEEEKFQNRPLGSFTRTAPPPKPVYEKATLALTNAAMDVPAACAFFDKALAAGASTADAAAFLVAKEVPAFVIAESLCVAETMDPRFGEVQGHP